MVSSGHVSKKKKKKMSGGGSISTSSSNVTIPQLCYHGDMEWLCYNTVRFYITEYSIPVCCICISYNIPVQVGYYLKVNN